jgi:hypothetical protein
MRRGLILKVFITVLLISGLRGLGATNEVYVTVSPPETFGDITNFTPAEISNAKTNPECRPAEFDPDGHWGPVVAGLQLGLRLSRTNYVRGDSLGCSVILRNTGQEVRSYKEDRWDSLTCGGTEFLVERSGKLLAVKGSQSSNFRERVAAARQGSWTSEPLAPGTQRKFICHLDGRFDCSVPGKYRVTATRPFPNPGGADSMLHVSSATAEFEVTAPPSEQSPGGTASPKPGQ